MTQQIIHIVLDYRNKKILIGEHLPVVHAGQSPARPAARILADAWRNATGFEVEEYSGELDRLDPNLEWDEQTGTWQPPEDFFYEPYDVAGDEDDEEPDEWYDDTDELGVDNAD